VHLVDIIIEIYHDARSQERQNINSKQSEDRPLHLHDINHSCYRHINLLSERTITRYLPFVIPTSEYENRGLPNYSGWFQKPGPNEGSRKSLIFKF